MSAVEGGRQHVKSILAPFRVGEERFRFLLPSNRSFYVACAAIALMVGVLVLGIHDFGPIEWVVAGLLTVAAVFWASLTIPRRCWIEIEHRPASWMFRWRFGWWRREREVSSRIAIASVVEQVGEFHHVRHFVQIACASDAPFARPSTPIRLEVTGWPTDVTLAVCITPGYSAETYLLDTDLRRVQRRR